MLRRRLPLGSKLLSPITTSEPVNVTARSLIPPDPARPAAAESFSPPRPVLNPTQTQTPRGINALIAIDGARKGAARMWGGSLVVLVPS